MDLEKPDVDFFPGFLSEDEAKECFAELMSEIGFKSERYEFESVVVETKRKVAYVGDRAYNYSGQEYSGDPWIPILSELKRRVEELTGFEFNAALCNLYENGEAGMGWHVDKEPELGDEPVIASLSLGAARRFAFRSRRDVSGLKNPPKVAEYMLGSGDLLIMKGKTQKLFEHCVIKDKSVKNPRINITFRKVVI